MALSGPRPVEDAQFDAVVSEMFGPSDGDDLADLGDESFDEAEGDAETSLVDGLDREAFGRHGGGRGRGGRRGGRGRGGRWGRRRWGGHRWHHRGPWFYPYWWWGYPTYYTVYPPADVDPEDLADEVVDSMFSARRRG